MSWWFWLSVGFIIGAYCNSDRAYSDGYAAGKWTRELFIEEQTQ